MLKIPFFKSKFYGLHQRVIAPHNMFKGVRKTVNFYGLHLELAIDDWIQENIYLINEYEKAELTYLKNSLQVGQTFIDIGANIGLFSLMAAKLVGAQGMVISFEPFEANYRAFCKNVVLNKLEQIQANKIAVTDYDGDIDLFYDTAEANKGMATTLAVSEGESEKVPACKLDSYFASSHEKREVHFIKLDIEGGEFPALKGMKNLLKQYKPILLIEMEDALIEQTDYTIEEMHQYLFELEYEKYYLTDEGELSKTETNQNRNNYIFK